MNIDKLMRGLDGPYSGMARPYHYMDPDRQKPALPGADLDNTDKEQLMSVLPRLQRLFGVDGKCFNVAIDHGFFNERSFLSGIEDMRRAIDNIVTANPDAIQLSPGQSPLLQELPGKQKPVLVLRSDVANVYGKTLPDYLFSQLVQEPVEQALALDAACVVVNLLLLPHQPDLYHRCIQNVCTLKPQCERYGMPLMIEPLVMQPNEEVGGYMVDGNIDKIVPLVRQAVELGADIIKADPCDNLDDYPLIIEAASGKPVLPRGGGRTTDEELLTRTAALIKHGAAGIVYGRNVIQHPHSAKMVEALMGIVHDGLTGEQALAIIQEA